MSQTGGKPALSGPKSLPALPNVLTGGRDRVWAPNPRAQSHLCTRKPTWGSLHLQVTTSNTLSASWQSPCFPTSQKPSPQMPGQPAGLPRENGALGAPFVFFQQWPREGDGSPPVPCNSSLPRSYQSLLCSPGCALSQGLNRPPKEHRRCPLSFVSYHRIISESHSLRNWVGSESIHWLCDLNIQLTRSEPPAP